ncbi:intracellular proteinase inhibitor domain-containing protein [Shewanella baltica OS183]|uniref:BsuPI-related putative proteinase inhibitor n=1 Tax=Shewanella baltica TaxID=62322 RepID=UPI0001E10C9A|nr:BsuPI-related putative proteinase inhibitor [Shewanella baltica]AEG11618.1 intracellular proteinase inhibitor domain-containing protein [Shewanella baltica BA175]EHQ14847.1 intracellular proteinase inhibitor domain-containing protein [Shewanella baltica OS183]
MVAPMRYALLVCASAFVGGQLVGCSAPEAADTSQSTKGETTTAAAVQPEIVRAADLALDVSGLKSTPTLKVEPMTTDATPGLLRGELALEPFVDFKQPVKAILTVTNPQTYAVGLRYNSGMTADLWLVTQEGKRLWAWSDDMMFTQALRDSQLAAGKVITTSFSIPPKAFAGIPAGGARLEAHFAAKTLESDAVVMAPVVLLLTME